VLDLWKVEREEGQLVVLLVVLLLLPLLGFYSK